jgi:hypothetical protein
MYDVRHDRDTINPQNHCFVMVRSSENTPGAHPYWYVQVIRVYHAFVSTTHPVARSRNTQHMEFLWVHWLGIDTGGKGGLTQQAN